MTQGACLLIGAGVVSYMLLVHRASQVASKMPLSILLYIHKLASYIFYYIAAREAC